MKAIIRATEKIESFICLIALAGMIVIVIANVFFRYMLNNAIPWTEEVSLMLFVWLTFVGVSYVMKKNDGHVSIDYFVRKASTKWFYHLQTARVIIIAVILLTVFIIWGSQLTLQTEWFATPNLGISYFWIYIAVPLGGLFAFFFLLQVLITRDQSYIQQEEEKNSL
ncbi:TRAP transporter small permease [Salicibibacter cibi]|uniref:TRAP transporter small permease n=1 Tax=Salicibibacter cibi TaxID=2743001 RepID=A0A7T6Z8F4_9BACI|nr:TRAP transporter small permease [Salicibibacter cibi]QQK78856.1 TRAP transporter small permease [Salicibibacter cibi]